MPRIRNSSKNYYLLVIHNSLCKSNTTYAHINFKLNDQKANENIVCWDQDAPNVCIIIVELKLPAIPNRIPCKRYTNNNNNIDDRSDFQLCLYGRLMSNDDDFGQ